MKKLLFLTLLLGFAATITAQEHRLWYSRPATHWLEALPVGNSHLGAMVYGGTNVEEIQLNEETFWSGSPHNNDSPEAKAHLQEVRQLIFQGKEGEAAKIIDKYFVKGRKLKEKTDIPIFHDDQHGTAVVTLAATINALKLAGKDIKNIKVVTSGAGAAGIAIIKLLIAAGLQNVIMCDRNGAIYKGRENLNKEKEEMAEISNKNMIKGSLKEVIKGADVFIGVSAAKTVTKDMVKSMAKNPILFPMANPIPEIMPDEAIEAGAFVVGTGRSDFSNQINNVLAFPGIFRGALDVRAKDINDEMKIAASYALANIIKENELRKDYIIPSPFNKNVKEEISKAVAEAAKKTKVARI